MLVQYLHLETPETRARSLAAGDGVHASLLLRNVGTKQISGITLRVTVDDVSPGAAAITVPGLSAKAGDTFPVRLDVDVARSFARSQRSATPLHIALDCLAFNDLSFYGEDRLHSRHSLLVYQLEARRERDYLSNLIQSGQLPAVREELNFGLPEDARQLQIELLPLPQANIGAQTLAVHPVSLSDCPVVLIDGAAVWNNSAISDPYLQIQNVSKRTIKFLEVELVLRDERGRESVVATMPENLALGPQQRSKVEDRESVKLSQLRGQPVIVRALSAFVRDVEFDDGGVWIPNWREIDKATENPFLRRAMTDSPEQERLAGIFRQTGIAGVEADLKRVN